MYKYLNILFGVLVFMITSGCMSTLHRTDYAQNAQVAKQVLDASAKKSTLILKLKQQGIQVVEVGETVSIILPSDPIFQSGSANLGGGCSYGLNVVADFLSLYSKTFVEVAGYTDNGGHADCAGDRNNAESIQKAHLLTAQQAAAVAHYLWSRGIDSRMLNTVGYGFAHPISNDHSPNGSAKIRRIEINFQYNEW
jgi:outer membrane protein OmpA-like peptidoglycan-associated protein